MTDPDEVLLPSEDEKAESLRPSDLDTLSSEARLATALVMQAQALEGMHSAQSDLLRRLDGRGTTSEMREIARDVGDSVRRVEDAQRQVLDQVRSSRRRLQLGVVAALVVLILAVAGLGFWIERRLGEQTAGQLDETRVAALLEAQANDRRETDVAWQTQLDELTTEQELRIASLGDQLEARVEAERAAGREALRDELAAFTELTDERDRFAARAEVLEQTNAGIAAELAASLASGGALTADFTSLEERHQRQIGENAQLRTQLLASDDQLKALRETLLEVETSVEQRLSQPEAIVLTEAEGSSLAEAANAALRASGADDARLAEVGGRDATGLLDLLVVQTDELGFPVNVVRGRRADLVLQEGRTLLRVQRVVDEGIEEDVAELAEDGTAEELLAGMERLAEAEVKVLDILLPEFDPAPWRALGLAVPDVTPLSSVVLAFQEVVEPWGLRVISAGGVANGHLLDVVIKEETHEGALQRTFRAERARLLADGPELVLEVGTITADGDERPFFRDTFHLALPGADLRPWLDVLPP